SGDDPAQWWVRARCAAGTPDRAARGPHPQPDHTPRLGVPRSDRRPSGRRRDHLEHPRRLLRRVDPHRGGRGPRDDETDRVAAHDAELRRHIDVTDCVAHVVLGSRWYVVGTNHPPLTAYHRLIPPEAA